MRIATWNLARPPLSGVRTAALLSFMAPVDADVWILTETRSSLAPGAGYRRVAVSDEAPDRGGDERWTAVWVRSGTHGEQIATADSERTACARLHLPSGRPFFVYGTVLPWRADRRRDPLRGSAAFRAALADQEADWQRIHLHHPGAVLCVAGDLNQDLLAQGHYYGSGEGRVALCNALSRTGFVCLTGGQDDPVVGFGGGRASIDHICVSGMTTQPGYRSPPTTVWPRPEQLGKRLSDHHGVAVDLVDV